MMKPSMRREQGMATRRKVLGGAHVDRAEAEKTEFDAPFQELITEAVWGHVWSRDTWDHRQRSIVTLALLCAQGHWEEVAMHIRATANTSASREDIQELILHVAIYVGVPTANHAIKVAKQTFAQMDDLE
jgi:4-carboxymuconolactone decarboxylase|tara:strand:+ start:1947 stop:2336 length:390 start_codon:yes stop_codon:yes gene_type:complete